MNRRKFIKFLSSIPLIGIPVKLLAKETSVVGEGFNEQFRSKSLSEMPYYSEDPYDAVAEMPWGYNSIIDTEKMNRDWVIKSNRVGKTDMKLHQLYRDLIDAT